MPHPQIFCEGEPVAVNMVPMATWDVTVVDEYDFPVVGVDVNASPWTNYAGQYARSELYLQPSRDDQDSYPHPFHQKSGNGGKLSMQLPAGKSTFSVKSDVYELPIFLGRREVRVESKWTGAKSQGKQSSRSLNVIVGITHSASSRSGEFD